MDNDLKCSTGPHEDPSMGSTRRSEGETPAFLLPRAEMRCGQRLADPEQERMLEAAWDARIESHCSVVADSHPLNEAYSSGRAWEVARDEGRLHDILLEIGRRFLGRHGAVPPEGLAPESAGMFVRHVGEGLLRSYYWEGCARIDCFERSWFHRNWHDLLGSGWISRQQYERLAACGGGDNRDDGA